jgi:hypothetical protein
MFGLVWMGADQQRHAGAERYPTRNAAHKAERLLLHDRSVYSVRIVEYGAVAYRPGRPRPPEGRDP